MSTNQNANSAQVIDEGDALVPEPEFYRHVFPGYSEPKRWKLRKSGDLPSPIIIDGKPYMTLNMWQRFIEERERQSPALAADINQKRYANRRKAADASVEARRRNGQLPKLA